MQPIAQTSTQRMQPGPLPRRDWALHVQWTMARLSQAGADQLDLAIVPGRARLERSEGAQTHVIRTQEDLPALEWATSSCGEYTSFSVRGVLDAVFSRDGRCVYARSAWIADLGPAGGQCELRSGQWTGRPT